MTLTHPLILVIGNKNYSSWSMRPWFALTMAGIPFEDIVIPLYEPGSAERIRAHSPAGKVPILIDGPVSVWESLAILEYLAERHPEAGLWPRDPAVRAVARVVANEMHAGFLPLRRECPMNMWHPPYAAALSAEAQANASRIQEIWSDCRRRFGEGGPFLFGAFTNADAMFAPIVSRFETYGVAVSPDARAYMDAIRATVAWRRWRAAALTESWVMPNNEPDWPQVPRLPS
ncbi:MAG TPA: glutathione S-transferase family protein [Xanthobacteraceae bacterium]|nr:glutathione S-transferase family protein [Xanthobacteraceae bacterium]